MLVALDTNVIAYAEGANGAARRSAALAVLNRLPKPSLCVPTQVLGALYNVLTRNTGFQHRRAATIVETWRVSTINADTTVDIMTEAINLSIDHQLSIWDAVILSAALSAECGLLLSEDMQDGFVWRGLTVANPFAATPHPLLASVLR